MNNFITNEFCQEPNNLDILDIMAETIINNVGEHIIVKGGYLLTNIINNARATKDLDFSIEEEKIYNLEVVPILEKIAETLIDKGIIDDYEIKDTPTKTTTGGLKTKINGVNSIGIDVGLHPIHIGNKRYKFRVSDNVNGFSIERILADKISASLSRKRFRRMKDFYDIYIIVTKFDYDEKEILNLISDRKPEWGNFPFSETILVELLKAWNKLNLVSPEDENVIIVKPDFREVMQQYSRLILDLKYKLGKVK